MEVEETEFETLNVVRANEQKTVSNLHKVADLFIVLYTFYINHDLFFFLRKLSRF